MTINGLRQALIGMAITAWAAAPGLAQPASSRITSAVARAPTRPTWNRGAEFSRASGLGDGNGCP